MKLIIITLPHFFDGEARLINKFFSAGLEILHLRKPEASIIQMTNLLEQIEPEFHSRIVVHSHFDLTHHYNLKGIHLNHRSPTPPERFVGNISTSCHSLEELSELSDRFDYLFLSPIFDSISKQGYKASFSPKILKESHIKGIINNKTIALGGICTDNISQVKGLGFGGVAILGDAWAHRDNIYQYLNELKQLL